MLDVCVLSLSLFICWCVLIVGIKTRIHTSGERVSDGSIKTRLEYFSWVDNTATSHPQTDCVLLYLQQLRITQEQVYSAVLLLLALYSWISFALYLILFPFLFVLFAQEYLTRTLVSLSLSRYYALIAGRRPLPAKAACCSTIRMGVIVCAINFGYTIEELRCSALKRRLSAYKPTPPHTDLMLCKKGAEEDWRRQLSRDSLTRPS